MEAWERASPRLLTPLPRMRRRHRGRRKELLLMRLHNAGLGESRRLALPRERVGPWDGASKGDGGSEVAKEVVHRSGLYRQSNVVVLRSYSDVASRRVDNSGSRGEGGEWVNDATKTAGVRECGDGQGGMGCTCRAAARDVCWAPTRPILLPRPPLMTNHICTTSLSTLGHQAPQTYRLLPHVSAHAYPTMIPQRLRRIGFASEVSYDSKATTVKYVACQRGDI